MHGRTPGTAAGDGGLDVHSDSREDADGDGEDEAHGECRHPDLRREAFKGSVSGAASAPHSLARGPCLQHCAVTAPRFPSQHRPIPSLRW